MEHEADELQSAPHDGRLVLEDRLRGKSLTVLSKSLVKPASETPSEKRWLAFSNLDLEWMPFYTPVLCAYREKPAGKDVGDHLRESLRKALELFYPLAGRVVTGGEQGPGIDCNDAGAVFVEASIDADVDEVQFNEDFQPSFILTGMEAAGMGGYPKLPDKSSGRPGLIVQLTHFRCGGITVAFNWAHPVADGYSGLHFLKSWAEIARGKEVSLLPVHERHLVKPRNPIVLSNPFPGVPERPDGNGDLTHDLHIKDTGRNSGEEKKFIEGKAEEKETSLIVQVIEISGRDVGNLKREVENGVSVAMPRLSRVSCVSAHLWRALVKARNLPGADFTRFWMLVEGRKKFSVPMGYFGNVLGSRIATTTVSDLLNKPLAFSAHLIQAAVQQATKDWYQDIVDWMEAKQDMERPGQVFGSEHECGASWQNRFPYYELDFAFGAPLCAMRNANGGWNGFVIVLPSNQNSENYTAMVHATPEVMERFIPLLHNFNHSSQLISS